MFYGQRPFLSAKRKSHAHETTLNTAMRHFITGSCAHMPRSAVFAADDKLLCVYAPLSNIRSFSREIFGWKGTFSEASEAASGRSLQTVSYPLPTGCTCFVPWQLNVPHRKVLTPRRLRNVVLSIRQPTDFRRKTLASYRNSSVSRGADRPAALFACRRSARREPSGSNA